jgi:uncharacterized protein YciI
MKYVNYIHYAGGSDAVGAIRPAHREYLAGLSANGQLVASGPFTDGSGALFIYEAGSLEQAEQLAAADPYAIGGVLIDSTVSEWELLRANPELLAIDSGGVTGR